MVATSHLVPPVARLVAFLSELEAHAGRDGELVAWDCESRRQLAALRFADQRLLAVGGASGAPRRMSAIGALSALLELEKETRDRDVEWRWSANAAAGPVAVAVESALTLFEIGRRALAAAVPVETTSGDRPIDRLGAHLEQWIAFRGESVGALVGLPEGPGLSRIRTFATLEATGRWASTVLRSAPPPPNGSPWKLVLVRTAAGSTLVAAADGTLLVAPVTSPAARGIGFWAFSNRPADSASAGPPAVSPLLRVAPGESGREGRSSARRSRSVRRVEDPTDENETGEPASRRAVAGRS